MTLFTPTGVPYIYITLFHRQVCLNIPLGAIDHQFYQCFRDEDVSYDVVHIRCFVVKIPLHLFS